MGKRIGVALLAIVVAVLAAEGALRLAWDADAAREEIRRIQGGVLAAIPGLEQEEVQGRIPHPYLGWDDKNRLEQHRTELEAYRRGDFEAGFEILVLGGSVSGLLGVKGAPAIQAALAADPRLAGRKIVLLNHGRGSFKQPQQVMLTAYLLGLGYRPDLILNVDGFNEVALGLDNASMSAHPLYPHWPSFTMVAAARGRSPEVLQAAAELKAAQAELQREAEAALASRRLSSGLLGRSTLRRVRALGARCGGLQDEVVRLLGDAKADDPTLGPRLVLPDPASAAGGGDAGGAAGAAAREQDALTAIVASWVEASIQIDAMARAHGIPYVHVLQPTLHDAGSKPLTESEVQRGTLKPSWRRGVVQGYPLLRAAGERLRERGVAFFDLTGVFQDLPEEAYYDGCHFRGESMRIFAEAVASAMLETLP